MSDGTLPPGATSGEDLSGLLMSRLSDRRLRDVAETEAIDRAYQKHVYRSRGKVHGSGWLTSEMILHLHHDMFGGIWEWAGKYRKEARNIGVEWHQIPEEIGKLCGDFKFWDSVGCDMSALEIAARLQNRLTRIHPFSNGNGRHARLITDMFFHSRKMKLPVWPQIHRLPNGDEIRNKYIASMKSADKEDYGPLVMFFEECLKPITKDRGLP